ncbi:MAG TPA: type II secretion system F family protein [Candidatus Sulfotelmatobacter sp.]|nr:type II secretion system F family protein [Candidatus Sulfotelmatobacter sp.]
MLLPILFGVSLFIALLLGLLFLMNRASVQGALLEEVAQQARGAGPISGPWRPQVSGDLVAKPFTTFRRFFASEPNQEIVRKLMLAGYRKPYHADIFLGMRLAVPAILGLTAALVFSDNAILFFLIALVVGFFAPDFWLSHAINSRRKKLKLSLPDGLDLLSICLEAGLGLDQAVVRVGQEMAMSHRELSEELLLINFEQRAGVQRIAAWQSFATRANFESARSFVAMLIQTDRFGTPIAKSLGAFSDALRTQRRQQAEERAAKTTIKLVPPLVFCIFPAMGIVVVGPAMVALGKFFAHFLHA